jgi:hypothetical protein
MMEEMDPDFPDPHGEAMRIGATLHSQVAMVTDAGHYPGSPR